MSSFDFCFVTASFSSGMSVLFLPFEAVTG